MTSDSPAVTPPRRQFVGTLTLRPKAAPEPEPPPPPAPPSRIEQRVADLATCRERWPRVFDAEHPLPLMVGVNKALGDVLGKLRAKRLLSWWCTHPNYLRAVGADDSMRHHLNAEPAGHVLAEHRAAARLGRAKPAPSGPS